MTLGNENDRQDGAQPSNTDREEAQPVSVPENGDFRYDEREAPDTGSQDEPRGSKPEA